MKLSDLTDPELIGLLTVTLEDVCDLANIDVENSTPIVMGMGPNVSVHEVLAEGSARAGIVRTDLRAAMQ